MRNAVFWDIKKGHTLQERYYVSTTKPSQLMLCKIWGYRGGNYEECRLLGCKKPISYITGNTLCRLTEPCWLMICKIWGYHGGDYEECRVLGYKNSNRISKGTHIVSTTEPSRLMLCKIWGFHGGDYEGCCLFGCKKASLYLRRNTLRLHYRTQPVNAA
jgi:hypothetical protein